MRLTQKITSTFNRYAKADGGATAILFAVSLVPIIAAAGAAIDFISFFNTRTHMQAALDAGSLAGATAAGASAAQRIQIATDTFNANMNTADLANSSIKVNFKPNAKTVEGSASLEMPTTLMSLVGVDVMNVGANSEVSIPTDKNAEIAFVLDYSGSMTEMAGSQVKYVAMRDAVTKLVNNLTASNASKLKFAMVPFSDQVYTDIPNPFVLGQFGPGMWTGCTLDNPSPYNLTDVPPSAGDASKWNQPAVKRSSCNGYVARNLKLRPLSNDFSGLKSQVASMTPYAYTHIALGVQFGYQALSPNGIYNASGKVAKYNDSNTIKYLVVLTDGDQTEPAFGPGGVRTKEQGEDNLVALCNNAKADGIQILTMAVGITNAATSARLQNCSSDTAKNFYVINTADDMAQAFSTITGQIAQQAYLSK
jgi:Flp pilus assembly protein TadG